MKDFSPDKLYRERNNKVNNIYFEEALISNIMIEIRH